MKVIKVISFLQKCNFTAIVINTRQDIIFYKNGKCHNQYGPAHIYSNGEQQWYYKGDYCYYGSSNIFTNKSWKKRVKELKREERLEIFI